MIRFVREFSLTKDIPPFPPVILHGPSDVTVYLDQSAEFTCEIAGGLSGWKVNGTKLEDLPPEVEKDMETTDPSTGNGTILSTLTIPARAKYDGTTFQCLSIKYGSSTPSKTATLRVQGTYTAVLTSFQKSVGNTAAFHFRCRPTAKGHE